MLESGQIQVAAATGPCRLTICILLWAEVRAVLRLGISL